MRIRQLSLPAWGWTSGAAPAAGARALAGPGGLVRRIVAVPASARWVHTQFKRTDDGAGGGLQTLRRGLKFWLRCCWSSGALQLSTSAFRESALDSIAESCPELPLRPLRSYLRRGLGSERRALALQAHFEWLAQQLPMGVIDGLYAGRSIQLLDADAPPLEGLGLSLSCAANLGREGELALHLEWRGRTVMSLGFSVLDAKHVVGRYDAPLGPGARIVIGTLQGAREADADLRELSSAAQRLRPSALLVLAAQALTTAWGLAPPLGVAAGSHVYSGYASRRRKVELDYDTAWSEAGAQRSGHHYWTLPARPVLRPDAEVESRRRAQHRRRNALRESLLEAVRAEAVLLRR